MRSYVGQEVTLELYKTDDDIDEEDEGLSDGGDITSKGYEKKRARLLAPYATKPSNNSGAAASPSTAAQRRAHRRLTREDNRYHSEIRTEAVMQALALHSKKQHIPMPSKRTSAVYQQHHRNRDTTTDSSSDDDSVFDERDEHRSNRSSRAQPSHGSDSSPGSTSGGGGSGSSREQPRVGNAIYANINIPGNTARSALADVMKHTTPSTQNSQVQQPPDLTSDTNTSRQDESRLNRYNAHHAHAQSVRVGHTGAVTGLSLPPEHRGKVSAKIQQLLNTLKRPKKKKVPTATLR